MRQAAGCEPEPPRLELATTADDERAADAVWQRLGLPPGDRVVILNSGGAYGAAKQWPAEYFAELARRIVSGEKYSVLVNCGPAEREIARDIAATANDPRVVTLADFEQLPVGLTKACIRRSRLLVTTDSGPRYFGVAFRAAGRHAVRADGPVTHAIAVRARNVPVVVARLPAVHGANVPAGPSPLHARVVGGDGARRGERVAGKRRGRVRGVDAALKTESRQ